MIALAHAAEFVQGMVGSSVSWSRLVGSSSRLRPKHHDSGWLDNSSRSVISSGVTESATEIQLLIQQLTDELSEWSMQRSSFLPDVENEVVVLMPPRREQIVTVHLHHAGRALPLVSLDAVTAEPADY